LGKEGISLKLSAKAKRAIAIGTLCASSYLAVYFARNILSAVSPQMQADGYSKEYIGSISANFLLFYALGQLLNGWLGDRIKARYMISFGLLFAGMANFFVYRLIDSPAVAQLLYGVMGIFLAMIYGPMTKVVAENTEEPYTVRCSIGYTFSSLFGTPLAGLLAAFFVWQGVFAVSSAVLVIMAVLCFLLFAVFEKKGIIKHIRIDKAEKGSGNIKLLIKRQIVKFAFVAMIDISLAWTIDRSSLSIFAKAFATRYSNTTICIVR
jgi:OPA family glycerol-3-phosphate transporter-like MFS transporter